MVKSGDKLMRTHPSMVGSLPQCEQPPKDTGIHGILMCLLCSFFLIMLNKHATSCNHCQKQCFLGEVSDVGLGFRSPCLELRLRML